MTTKTLICDCNQTMPLNPKALGAALQEDLTLHSTLCRSQAGAYQQAIRSGDPVVVAHHCFGCTAGGGSSCGGALGSS